MRALALLVALISSALTPAAASNLDLIRDPTALRSLFSGRTLYARYADGERVAEFYSPDGRSAYRQYQCLHAGKWWVDQLPAAFGSIEAGTPMICFKYASIEPADRPTCFAVGGSRGAERFYPLHGRPEYAELPVVFAVRWAEGNAEPLPLDVDNCPSV
jgi:hypothetical protein